MDDKNQQTKIDDNLKELVEARIDLMPPNYKLSIGNKGTFTKEQLIEHVRSGDEIGMNLIETELSFIKALTNGQFIQALNENE
jgi:hypothetical protein